MYIVLRDKLLLLEKDSTSIILNLKKELGIPRYIKILKLFGRYVSSYIPTFLLSFPVIQNYENHHLESIPIFKY